MQYWDHETPIRVIARMVKAYNEAFAKWQEVTFTDEAQAQAQEQIMNEIVEALDTRFGLDCTHVSDLPERGLFLTFKEDILQNL